VAILATDDQKENFRASLDVADIETGQPQKLPMVPSLGARVAPTDHKTPRPWLARCTRRRTRMSAATARNARTDSNQLQPSDPLSAAITAAVDAGLAARLPSFIDAVKAAMPKESAGPAPLDRFVPMREVVQALGCTRSTVHRRAAAGTYPPIRKQGGSAGYLARELAEIMNPAEVALRRKDEQMKSKAAEAKRARKSTGARR
jgi:predicted DNA-binding transcriptional regulator AlpA